MQRPYTKEEQIRINRGKARYKYNQITNLKNALNLLVYRMPKDILQATNINRSELVSIRNKLNIAILNQSKTFTVCPKCYSLIKTRKPPKKAKNFSDHNCNICNAKNNWSSGFRKIRHKTDLQTTLKELQNKYPEHFI